MVSHITTPKPLNCCPAHRRAAILRLHPEGRAFVVDVGGVYYFFLMSSILNTSLSGKPVPPFGTLNWNFSM